MTKAEMIAEIPKLCNAMRAEMLGCGVGKKRIENFSKDLEVQSFKKIQETWKFLMALANVEHSAIIHLRAQLPESAWQNYKLLGYTNMPEQVALKNLQLSMLRKVRKFNV